MHIFYKLFWRSSHSSWFTANHISCILTSCIQLHPSKIYPRFYSNYTSKYSNPTHTKHRQILKKSLKNLYAKVHPDLFLKFPEIHAKNQTSMKILNAFFDQHVDNVKHLDYPKRQTGEVHTLTFYVELASSYVKDKDKESEHDVQLEKDKAKDKDKNIMASYNDRKVPQEKKIAHINGHTFIETNTFLGVDSIEVTMFKLFKNLDLQIPESLQDIYDQLVHSQTHFPNASHTSHYHHHYHHHAYYSSSPYPGAGWDLYRFLDGPQGATAIARKALFNRQTNVQQAVYHHTETVNRSLTDLMEIMRKAYGIHTRFPDNLDSENNPNGADHSTPEKFNALKRLTRVIEHVVTKHNLDLDNFDGKSERCLQGGRISLTPGDTCQLTNIQGKSHDLSLGIHATDLQWENLIGSQEFQKVCRVERAIKDAMVELENKVATMLFFKYVLADEHEGSLHHQKYRAFLQNLVDEAIRFEKRLQMAANLNLRNISLLVKISTQNPSAKIHEDEENGILIVTLETVPSNILTYILRKLPRFSRKMHDKNEELKRKEELVFKAKRLTRLGALRKVSVEAKEDSHFENGVSDEEWMVAVEKLARYGQLLRPLLEGLKVSIGKYPSVDHVTGDIVLPYNFQVQMPKR